MPPGSAGTDNAGTGSAGTDNAGKDNSGSDNAGSTNARLVEELIDQGHLAVRRGELFDQDPADLWPVPPQASAVDRAVEWDRVEGMMLGLTIGDALGNPCESMLPGPRRKAFGEIRDYVVKPSVGESAVPSDDTQLAYLTLEQLLEDDGHVVPEHLADRFVSQKIFGMGQAVGQFRRAWQSAQAQRERLSDDAGAQQGQMEDDRLAGGRGPSTSDAHAVPKWYDCAARSAGNGALMRIAPVLIPHLRKPSRELWADTTLAAAVTHNDPTSISACLAFSTMLWELLGMRSPPPPEWWWRRYVEVARDLEGDAEGEAVLRPRGGLALTGEGSADGRPFEGSLWRFVEEYVPRAHEDLRSEPDDRAVLAAGDVWYSGAFLLETVPSALFILMRCGDDPEEAIVRAVNDTKDNDTIGAIVGAAVGALHGRAALPERWVSGLKGRISYDDDGRVFELLDEAAARWSS